MKRLIKKILKEDREQMFLDKIIQVMKNDFPLIKNLKDYGFYEQLSRDELNYVLSGIFGKPVEYYEGGNIYDENNKRIYNESSDGYWIKKEYDENGNEIYYEVSDGYWEKYEYDKNGNMIYFEDSDGYWKKYKYNEYGNNIYWEDSDGVIRDNR
jgi:hypothetical protein